MGETKKQAAAREKAEAIAQLRKYLKPGATVHTILRHIADSGMYRVIDVYVFPKGEPIRLTWAACTATGTKYDTKREGAARHGCGYDVGHDMVYNIARVLWPRGVPCTGDECPSNAHNNGDRDYRRHTAKAPHLHRDGGYGLRHRWL